MNTAKDIKPGQESHDHLAEPGVYNTTDINTRRLTLAGQVMATIKILACFGVAGGALWAVEFWISGG